MFVFSWKSFAVSPTRRIFSVLSSDEKPKSLQRPWRTLSPSRTITWHPMSKSSRESALAIVDFPDPESPVNQRIAPLCPFFSSRISSVIWKSSQRMFFDLISSLSVAKNVMLPQIAIGAPGAKRKQKAHDLLKHFGVFEQTEWPYSRKWECSRKWFCIVIKIN